MILGLGNDLIRTSRIAAVWQRHGDRFCHKLLMPAEQAALADVTDPVNRLAKAFAAKEALVKALGTGFRGVSHVDSGVLRAVNGAPRLVFSARLAGVLQTRGIELAHLALTDQDDWVLATVVLEGSGPRRPPPLEIV
ncbi:holo-ACP synthase [Flagellatimonas centrodinii]|uniref:holo-ACP synthase n=1 Tax=Flagellatimonas centrodinii TaxID=2806210 RepID=UPI001FF7ABE3|nr:holo-ACP synthase [Flagellatimonas centrodinii]ULQ46568.1 holo-ACP synthase [Flagellatimonas centrodinii]